ncbi:VIT domain-containing protein [Halopseudomonas pachastrellae]|nr:VIT domain-containing protein [Halopseudomonas pachastrellae]
MFLFRSDDGSWQPALLLNTDMQVQVSGPVAEVQIRQSFSNPGGAFAEGRYVLPTSEGAAVHAMTLEIGERRINGVIQEREQARKTMSKPATTASRPAWSSRSGPTCSLPRSPISAQATPSASSSVTPTYCNRTLAATACACH